MPYYLYFSGLILLLLPFGLFARSKYKVLSISELSARKKRWLSLFHIDHGFDLVRGYIGYYLLQQAWLAVGEGSLGHVYAKLLLTFTVTVGLVMQQVFVAESQKRLTLPAFYCLGLVSAFFPVEISILALGLGIATTFAFRSLEFGFIFAATTCILLGVLFGGSVPWSIINGLLFLTPLFVAFILRMSLGLAARREPRRARSLRDTSGAINREEAE
jgi:hypothetical protein